MKVKFQCFTASVQSSSNFLEWTLNCDCFALLFLVLIRIIIFVMLYLLNMAVLDHVVCDTLCIKVKGVEPTESEQLVLCEIIQTGLILCFLVLCVWYRNKAEFWWIWRSFMWLNFGNYVLKLFWLYASRIVMKCLISDQFTSGGFFMGLWMPYLYI